MYPGQSWTTLTRGQRMDFLLNNEDTVQYSSNGGAGAQITYSFPTSMFTEAFYVPAGENLRYESLDGMEQAFVRESLAYLSSFLGTKFVETGGNADLEFGKHNMTAGGYGNNTPFRYVMLSTESDSSKPGDYAFDTLVHELGHALGLKHPGDYSFQGFPETGPFLSQAFDNGQVSMVTYNHFFAFAGYGYTFRPLDIVALQEMYGTSTASDPTMYSYYNDDQLFFQKVQGGWAVSDNQAFLVVDTGGYDTLNFSTWHSNGAIGREFALELDLEKGGGFIGEQDPTGNISNFATGQWDAMGSDIFANRLFNVEVFDFSAIEEVVGTDYADYIAGNADVMAIFGGGGNDVLLPRVGAGAADVLVDGGAGEDTAVFTEYRVSDLHINVANGGHYFTFLDGTNAEASYGVTRIESVELADGKLGWSGDIGGVAGEAFRIYQAAFDRTPDLGGLGFWYQQMEAGKSLLSVAAFFVTSQEFQSLYGRAPSNGDFIERLYENVLGRAGETGGIDFWLGEMNSGRMDKASVLANFSESSENIAGVAPTIAEGIWYQI